MTAAQLALSLVISALATWQIIEIWHHSELFAGRRAKVENWDNWFGRLLCCPFCMSPLTALVAFMCVTPTEDAIVVPSLLAKLFMYAMAISRLANLGNDLTQGYCLTPRANSELPPSNELLSEEEDEST